MLKKNRMVSTTMIGSGCGGYGGLVGVWAWVASMEAPLGGWVGGWVGTKCTGMFSLAERAPACSALRQEIREVCIPQILRTG